MPGELTYKQRLFVEAYLGEAGGNATEAARLAGYAWPKKVAERLVGKSGIRAAIDARLDEAALTANQVLARLSDIATGDLGDFLTIDDAGAWSIDMRKAKRAGRTHLIKKIKASPTGTEIELHSPLDALDKLGKYRRLFVERIALEEKQPAESEAAATFKGRLAKLRPRPNGDRN
jgi:phage terminase small subunit